MSVERIFIDTNILVYAHDPTERNRHRQARDAIAVLWDAAVRPAISVQVLQEMVVTLQRKDMDAVELRETVEDYLRWDVVHNTPTLLMSAIRMQQEYQLSFWDASILAAAHEVKAGVLWSEDFFDGRRYGDVTVKNPLAE